MLSGEIGGFCRIGDEIVEFFGSVLGDELELVVDDDAAVAMAEGEGFGAFLEVFCEEGFQADAVEVVGSGRIWKAGDVGEGGKDIDGAGGELGDAGFDNGGPFNDAGNAKTAFEHGVL